LTVTFVHVVANGLCTVNVKGERHLLAELDDPVVVGVGEGDGLADELACRTPFADEQLAGH
jgi:hypothetical protein